jgi:hypothetical protein
MKEQMHVRVIRLRPWQVVLAAGVVLFVLAALLFLTFTALLIVLPIALVAGAIAYLFGGKRPPGGPDGGVIEGEYRVVEPREIERNRPS